MAFVKKGDTLSDFTLQDQNGEKISLSDIKGKVLLSFHPFAFTSVCTDQMRALERNYENLQKKGITALGISVDTQPCKAIWAQILALENVKILADATPSGALSKACGIWKDDLFASGRANIIVENGKVIWAKEYDLGELPDLQEILLLDL